MRLLVGMSLMLLAGTGALAQRGGPARMGGGPIEVAPNPGLPTVSPIPALQPIPALGLASQGFGGGGANFPRRPFGVSGYPVYPVTGGYSAYPQMQNVVVLQAAPQATVISAPPPTRPPQSMIWEAPEVSAERLPREEPRAFAIALKDGTTVSASAVWVQDNILHYVDTEGAHKRATLDTIDRDITRRLNQAQNLVLRLPPPQ